MDRQGFSILIKRLDGLLATAATHYMKRFQGDILIDHQTIVERLEGKGEVEFYIAKHHFDTEAWFELEFGGTLQARAEARKRQWGDWTILVKVAGKDLEATFTKTREEADDFPFERLFGWNKVSDYTYTTR